MGNEWMGDEEGTWALRQLGDQVKSDGVYVMRTLRGIRYYPEHLSQKNK